MRLKFGLERLKAVLGHGAMGGGGIGIPPPLLNILQSVLNGFHLMY